MVIDPVEMASKGKWTRMRKSSHTAQCAVQGPEEREKGCMSAIMEIVLSPSWLKVFIASLMLRS